MKEFKEIGTFLSTDQYKKFIRLMFYCRSRSLREQWRMILFCLYMSYNCVIKTVLLLYGGDNFTAFIAGDHTPLMDIPTVCRYIYWFFFVFILETIWLLLYEQKLFMPCLLDAILHGKNGYFLGSEKKRNSITQKIRKFFAESQSSAHFLQLLSSSLY